MLLQRLVEYHDNQLPVAIPPMYGEMVIKWIIDLDDNGNFIGLVPTSSGVKKDKGKKYICPHIAKTSGVRSRLLAENGEYVLGKARKPKSTDPKKIEKELKTVVERNLAFVECIRQASAATDESSLKAILNFYESGASQHIEPPKEFEPTENLTFRINGFFPFDLPSIKAYWVLAAKDTTKKGKGKTEKGAKIMECIVCGEQKQVVSRLPFKLKKLPSDSMAEFTLISANKPAFESYGLEESHVSPICSEDAEKFSKAANALLEGEDTRITVGPLAYIFWTKKDDGFSFATFLSKPDAAEVKSLIESAFTGREAALALDNSAFYAAAFSASGARAAIRDWLETTVGNVKQNLARYFRLQRIIEPDGSAFKPMGLSSISSATVPLKQEKPDYNKIPPNVPKALLKCALEGKPLPDWLLYKAVQRIKAEAARLESPKHDWRRKSCATLIKMVLASHTNEITQEGIYMEQLDHTNRDAAYLCGRLLGVLESVQYAALHKSNSSIIGRFYGTASSAPASVFGPLLRGAQAHLDKLRKTKEGTYNALQQKLEEVQNGMTAFPKILTLQQQGLFALGYYHQRAKDRADREAYKQMKANESSDTNQ